MPSHAGTLDSLAAIREGARNRLDEMRTPVATATSGPVMASFERIADLIQWMRDQDQKEQDYESLRQFHWYLALAHACADETLPDTDI